MPELHANGLASLQLSRGCEPCSAATEMARMVVADAQCAALPKIDELEKELEKKRAGRR